MFKTLRIFVLLLILFCVSVNSALTRSRSTDWNDSLYVKVYPINADGSRVVDDYVASLSQQDFSGIEDFIAREAQRYGRPVARPVRMELGEPVAEQPPALGRNPSVPQVMWWSLRLRWWASGVADEQDRVDPDVRIFVRYFEPREQFVLEDSVGLQKGMVGIVNALAGRHHAATNNVVIAHEFLHTLGATDKYHPENGAPYFPIGYAEPERNPRHPQRRAEIMGGRIALSEQEAVMPGSLESVIIGEATALEIRLRDQS